MNVKHFLDTNVLIYSVNGAITLPKKKRAIQLLHKNAVISTQVISESINVMSRKLKYDYTQIRLVVEKVVSKAEVYVVTPHTIRLALTIAEKYGFSYYDSQILASALENHCHIFYSEDLQHGQVIERRLQVMNPFL